MTRLTQARPIWLIVALGTCIGFAASQEKPHLSTEMTIRQQLGALASQVVDSIQPGIHGLVFLQVEPSSGSSLAQNAFVEVLQQRGCRATLKSPGDSLASKLTINVLTDRAQFREIERGLYERVVLTELEGRVESVGGEAVKVLGIFRRSSTDTVSTKDTQALVPYDQNSANEDGTFFQRLAGPLIVLASGILVVYLFFTVRS